MVVVREVKSPHCNLAKTWIAGRDIIMELRMIDTQLNNTIITDTNANCKDCLCFAQTGVHELCWIIWKI